MAIASAILGVTPAIADELSIKPRFAMMDNTGDGTELTLDAATVFSTKAFGDALVHPRVLLQYVGARGLGAYASTAASVLIDHASQDRFGHGNLEFGGLYQHALSAEVAIGVRAGLIVGITDLDVGTIVNAAATVVARPGDLATATPDSWIRFGVSSTYQRGNVFARLDAGVDIAVGSERDLHPIEHVNVGLGLAAGRWSFTQELGGVRVSNVSDSDTLVVAGLAARYHGERASPFVMLSLPLNYDVAGEVGDLVTLTVGTSFSP
ncbi:MAG TPA: hypothetical protein VFT22_44180 [Kofleriaceae bacterium]|nr:hypothetical protein [Kofleriaceae bacterium]